MQIEKWNIFEIKLNGTHTDNPFTQVNLTAEFRNARGDTKKADGFYDGDGIYKIRFMPDAEGEWEYTTSSNMKALDKQHGAFTCVTNSADNHGMVQISRTYHFAYADGTPFYPFGTTCYAWIHQPEDLQKKTLETLKNSCFNKLRMCVFPKFYANNSTEPELYPFEGAAPDQWDYSRFNPAFFRHLEWAVEELLKLGIEVDLILFHPYDRGHWGFDRMDRETDLRYLNYIIARLSAYRNIWWSLANEYDYMEKKVKKDWDENVSFVAEHDIYHHLRSIHQGDVLYDHWRSDITHASIQLGTTQNEIPLGFGVYKAHRDVYQKAVIYDEVGYEGNLPQRWGCLSAPELIDKYWMAIVSGAYMTHGETFQDPQDIIWWAKGGILKGECEKRIAFLKSIIEESHSAGLEPLDRWWILNGAGVPGEYYLFYFGEKLLKEWEFKLPAFKTPEIPIGTKFEIELIDTWNMEITRLPELFEADTKNKYCYTCSKNPTVAMPDKKFMAIRIRKHTD